MKILTGILAAALTCAACDIKVDEGGIRGLRIAEGRAEDVWTRSYAVGAGGQLEIEGQVGDIEVEAASGPRIEVRAEREVNAGSDEAARTLLAKLQIKEEVAPDRVRLETAGDDAAFKGLGRRGARIAYHVKVPAGLSLKLSTQNGGVQLNNVNGHIEATTTNGGITASEVSGSLAAQTVNGSMRVDMSAVAGEVELNTTNGSIRAELPLDVKATLDASAVNGNVTLDGAFLPGSPDRSMEPRHITAKLNGGGPPLSVSTVNGTIRVRVRGARPE